MKLHQGNWCTSLAYGAIFKKKLTCTKRNIYDKLSLVITEEQDSYNGQQQE
jgi:hypothetical protein